MLFSFLQFSLAKSLQKAKPKDHRFIQMNREHKRIF